MYNRQLYIIKRKLHTRQRKKIERKFYFHTDNTIAIMLLEYGLCSESIFVDETSFFSSNFLPTFFVCLPFSLNSQYNSYSCFVQHLLTPKIHGFQFWLFLLILLFLNYFLNEFDRLFEIRVS